jgi:hypothetical protein
VQDPSRPKVLRGSLLRDGLAVPLVVTATISVATVIVFRYRLALYATLDWPPSMLGQLRDREATRWVWVLGTTALMCVLAGSVDVLWRWSAPRLRLAMGILLLLALLGSISAAYRPERALLESGWSVHPPRIAIFMPAIAAAVTIAVIHLLRRWRPVA